MFPTRKGAFFLFPQAFGLHDELERNDYGESRGFSHAARRIMGIWNKTQTQTQTKTNQSKQAKHACIAFCRHMESGVKE